MMVCLSPNGLNRVRADAPPKRVFVGTLDGVTVLEREGAGNAWRNAGQALKGLHISSLLFEPRRGGLFAGIHGSGLYASSDGGQKWDLKTRGLTQPHVYSLAALGNNGDTTLYAGTEPAHLFRSTDYGESWGELSTLRSVPGNEKWMFPAPPHQGHVKGVVFDPRDRRTLFACIEQGGLFKTADGGQTWRELAGYSKPEDLAYRDVHRLVLRPSNPDVMYITSGEGLYCSTDGGEHWEHLTNRSFRIGYPDQLHVSPYDDKVMFMSGSSKSPNFWRDSHVAESTVARSRDGGRSWEVLEQGLPKSMRANIEAISMAVWPDGYALFAGTTDGDVFHSDNEGKSWSRIAAGLPPVSKVGHYRFLR